MRDNGNAPDFSNAFRLSPTNSDSDENLDFIDLSKQPENYLGANSVIDRVLSARARASPQPRNVHTESSNEDSDASRKISLSSKESARSNLGSRQGARSSVISLTRRQSFTPTNGRRSSVGSKHATTRRKSSLLHHGDGAMTGRVPQSKAPATGMANPTLHRMSTVRSPMTQQNPRAIHRSSSQLSTKLHVLLVSMHVFMFRFLHEIEYF